MTTLHSYKDSPSGCFANVRMDNGDPCFISVAQAGVLVKKSKMGFLGAKLYEEKRVYEAAMTAKALTYLYPKRLSPTDITNPVLNAFTNAVLHCCTLAEVTRVLNEAVREAEETSGQPIAELEVIPGGKPDLGLEVLDFLFDSMGIDKRWSVREDRSFTWWGHRLAQQVWVEPARQEDEFEIFRLHARTDFLRNVPASFDTAHRIAALNKFATLNAFVWDGERLSLHCSAKFHAETIGWVKQLFMAAVAIQVADAHAKIDMTAQLLDGEPDTSAHPECGPRPELDEMLNILESYFSPEGEGDSPFSESDFAGVLNMEPRPWVMASGNGGITAEFPFYTDQPTALSGGEPGTALLRASAEDRHPQLGSGALIRLTLPMNLDLDKATEVANELNVAETREWTRCHLLGAWCADDALKSVTFVTFLPAAVYRSGLLDAMVLNMAMRTRWARAYLS